MLIALFERAVEFYALSINNNSIINQNVLNFGANSSTKSLSVNKCLCIFHIRQQINAVAGCSKPSKLAAFFS